MIAIHSFWRTGTEAIFDIRVTDTEAASKRNKDPDKVLRQQEEEKKRKYLNHCQQAHKHFTPLVYSVDGLEGKEATAMRKQLASNLSQPRWQQNFREPGTRATSNVVRKEQPPGVKMTFTTASDLLTNKSFEKITHLVVKFVVAKEMYAAHPSGSDLCMCKCKFISLSWWRRKKK